MPLLTKQRRELLRDYWKLTKQNWKLYSQNRLGIVGLIIVLIFVGMALLAPVIAPRDPLRWYAPSEDITKVNVLSDQTSGDRPLWANTTFEENISEPSTPRADAPAQFIYFSSSNGSVYAVSSGKPQKATTMNDISNKKISTGGQIAWKYTDPKLKSQIPLNGAAIGYYYCSMRGACGRLTGGTVTTPLKIFGLMNETGNVIVLVEKFSQTSDSTTVFITQLWSTTLVNETPVGLTFSSPALSGVEWQTLGFVDAINGSQSRMIITTQKGMVYNYHATKNFLFWKMAVSNQSLGRPYFIGATYDIYNKTNTMVVFSSDDGYLYGIYDKAVNNTTALLWKWKPSDDSFDSKTELIFKPINYFDIEFRFYAISKKGNLYAIKPYLQDVNNSTLLPVATSMILDLSKDVQSPGKITSVGITFAWPTTRFLVTGTNKYLYAYEYNSSATGNESLILKYRLNLGSYAVGSMVYNPDNDYLYFITADRYIYVFRVMNRTLEDIAKEGAKGLLLWSHKIIKENSLNVQISSPALFGSDSIVRSGLIVVTTSDGRLIAYEGGGEYLAPLPPGCYDVYCYWLGTDVLGRDIWSQLVWGSQAALFIGFAAAFFGVVISLFVGLISGYFGKGVDTVLMRFTDVMLTLPFLPLVIVLAAVLGPNIWNLILALTIVGWPGSARVIRAQVLSLKARAFIDSARVSGASDFRIIFRHIMPNVIPLALLFMTLGVGGAIATEAALSFLGLGDPTTITWGVMLNMIQSSGYTLTAWWWLLPPGLAITMVTMAFLFISRAFDEVINPRLRRR